MAIKTGAETERNDQNLTAAQRERELREKGYREKALKIHPWVCARCGREFSGKKLRDLTVHHKDHNHENNPADGSNWELLCIYCHDNEHGRNAVAEACGALRPGEAERIEASQTPFAGLAGLLKAKTTD
ncbi:YajD family HNH nuclease [Thiovibrio sp. JS02]